MKLWQKLNETLAKIGILQENPLFLWQSNLKKKKEKEDAFVKH